MVLTSPPCRVVGWLGLTCGLLALAVSLLPAWFAPLYDPPAKPFPARTYEWLRQLRDYTNGAAAPEDRAVPPDPAATAWRSPRLVVASLSLAFAALALAAVAFVQREDPRMVACTVALAAGAMAGHSLITALMVLLVAVTAVALAVLAQRA